MYPNINELEVNLTQLGQHTKDPPRDNKTLAISAQGLDLLLRVTDGAALKKGGISGNKNILSLIPLR